MGAVGPQNPNRQADSCRRAVADREESHQLWSTAVWRGQRRGERADVRLGIRGHDRRRDRVHVDRHAARHRGIVQRQNSIRRSSRPAIDVMQATEDGRPNHSPVPVVWRRGAPRSVGWVEPERLMRAGPVVIRDVLPHDAAQVALAQHDHMLQALAPDRPDDAFRDRVGLRCPDWRQDRRDAEPVRLLREVATVGGVPVPDRSVSASAVNVSVSASMWVHGRSASRTSQARVGGGTRDSHPASVAPPSPPEEPQPRPTAPPRRPKPPSPSVPHRRRCTGGQPGRPYGP